MKSAAKMFKFSQLVVCSETFRGQKKRGGGLPFIMAYDLDVVRSLETKRTLLGRAIDERWTVVFGHDKDLAAARLAYDADGNIVIKERVNLA